jgi:hypothetical protein
MEVQAQPCHKRDCRAFTAIEMVAVLFLSALMATLSIASLAGVRRSAQLNDAIDQLARCNETVRRNAARLHSPLRLVLDPATGVVTEEALVPIDGGSGLVLYRLPPSFRFARCIFRGGNEAFGEFEIAVAASGAMQSYAVEISGPKENGWALVAGLTGQVTRINDESKIMSILQSLSPAGDDAH